MGQIHGISIRIDKRIQTDAAMIDADYRGSPTFLVNGQDLETAARQRVVRGFK